jgi:hypothetical protein
MRFSRSRSYTESNRAPSNFNKFLANFNPSLILTLIFDRFQPIWIFTTTKFLSYFNQIKMLYF